MTDNGFLRGRLLLVAFEGWNDAGEAATGALKVLKEQLDVIVISEVDAEEYFDFQFNRPNVVVDDDGKRVLEWPGATFSGPDVTAGDRSDGSNVYLLIGSEPSRNWRSFTAEVMNTVLAEEITGIVLLGAMLADVPHTRPISVFSTSENPLVRSELDIERSTYEGPVGILSVIADAAESAGVPTVSIWASVPHYVHNAPSPKATLALVEKIEELIGLPIERGELIDESTAWESGIDALAGEDDDMAAYIRQLEQARDTVDSPEASGEAIAQEFERYLRKRGDGGRGDGRAGGDGRPDEPWRRD
ncbi:PAC2 family protein [Herbiconiux sp. KACC 21604]|uniref:PAC2 family protein n=1 Tax=unclassified Herbiconiux TaxID=2618217 RepID=UPI0020A48240|nr:PAC2 family protein [Herbiconiux sp. SALV-R1]WPO88493.1 PAC2 family protein [Herbiconiux sp. KACC 21604]